MKILADEDLESQIVAWLRALGHDVSFVAELTPAATDPAVLEWANSEGRILITSDLDFGEMVYRQHLDAHGIVLLRIGAQTWPDRLAVFTRHWPDAARHASGHFVVISDDRVRVRGLAHS